MFHVAQHLGFVDEVTARQCMLRPKGDSQRYAAPKPGFASE